jgi:altronate dehydratase large subunit
MNTLMAYTRPDGRRGIRNLLAVVAATDAANPVARRLAAALPDCVAITPLYGRGQLGDDLALSVRTMIGLGSHPNVYATLVVSLERVAGTRVYEGIRAAGTPCEVMGIQEEGGTPALFRRGRALLEEWRAQAQELRRTPARLSEFVIGLECGGSDTTSGLVANPAIGLVTDRIVDAGGTAIFSEPVECLGGEAALAARAASTAVRDRIDATIRKYEEIARRAGVDLNKTNPAPDNIRGGLTTIEEKSLGSICKTGSRRIDGVLGYGEAAPGPGLYLMDAPAPATENITALAAGGCHLILFATGVGNSIGNPVSPTVKLCGNDRTCRTFADHIDVDLSAVLLNGHPLEQAGMQVEQAMAEIINGRPTCCEILGETETAISRIGESV